MGQEKSETATDYFRLQTGRNDGSQQQGPAWDRRNQEGPLANSCLGQPGAAEPKYTGSLTSSEGSKRAACLIPPSAMRKCRPSFTGQDVGGYGGEGKKRAQ